MKRYLIPVMLLVGAAAPAFAQPNDNNSSLDPDLRAKVEVVSARFRDQAKPLWQDARATRESLKTELQKAQPDDGTLVRLEDRLASDRQQMQALHAQQQAELKKELSPRQYAQLVLSRPRFGRRMHGGGRGHGGGEQ
ncbi:MAG TPA: hypothetical protein VF945_09025 [Polyangia bacterium]